ncbi:15-hydroxyprostaglandin dehydrogenase [NAD(+)]-like [Argiope bruennichi]|uniref:15-hydroxyprostaglandin dehydrogenase [NAD(+)]-like n=1 Tax=Argiope bruennichi TaxID=94029 RepID=UPI002495196D|nr:15-hydroxyprostaglandin dehydrogenase [NAD(+)]-like [Argiope bruennichi]
MNFADKVALVTGGSQGIGRALVSALLSCGMKVNICDVDGKAAKEFIETLPSTLREYVTFQQCDVTSFEDFKDAFDKVISSCGRVDLVVNNAGLHDEINWRKVIDVNIVGVINGTKLGFEYMDVRKGAYGGDIVNMASVAGLSGNALHPVYSATKHAVVGFTKSYGSAYHLERTGVRVNAICPTLANTNLQKNIYSSSLDEGECSRQLANINILEPEDVAKALAQLLQDGKNGALLRVDPNGTSYV